MQLFETIRIENGQAWHLAYHTARFNTTRKALFGIDTPHNLSDALTKIPPHGLYRARLVYNDSHITVTYHPYTAKKIRKIKLLSSPISYPYKYNDRTTLDTLLKSHPTYDEILIIQDGLLTDTTIANIVLQKEGNWYTPKTPLLSGTTRARLLDEGKLIERDIKPSEIDEYDSVALMNAMIGFTILDKEIEICP